VAAEERALKAQSLIQWMPPAASDAAARSDWLFFALLGVTAFVAVCIFTTIIVFVVRYREGSAADRASPPSSNVPLEAAWIAAPLAIFIAFFAWAGYEYAQLQRPPVDAMPIYVVAKQWTWKLQHANGRREVTELHVPLDRPVRLIMTSEDVIHSFYAPALRVKQDLVPGRYTALWFQAQREGEYHLLCAEYCGTQHAGMRGRIIAMAPDAFARWLGARSEAPGLAARGFELFRQYGCSGCHSVRSTVHAPDLTGLMERVVRLADGRRIVADESYVRDSILLPKKDVVAGYEPLMPSYAGQIAEEEIAAIIHYIRSTETR
jgi:cytochrome c oxidase subunit 2